MGKTAIGVVAIGVVAGLALSGCGTGEGSADKGAPADGGYVSPLEDYMSALFRQPSADDQNAMDAKYNDILVKCMADQGFEFKVDPSQQVNSVDASSQEGMGLDESKREFAEQYGYGLSTNPWMDPKNSTDAPEESHNPVDPNQEYINSLSETAKKAYEEALYGVPAASSASDDESGAGAAASEYRWQDNGCYGKANHEAYEQQGGYWEDPKYSSLTDAIQELHNPENPYPGMAELNAKWSSCMAEAGFSGFATPQDAIDSIQNRMNKYWGEDPSAGGSKELTEQQWAAFQSELQKRISADITPDEIKTALADWDCKDKLGYLKAESAARVKAEEDFIAQHKSELDELLAQYGTK